MKLHKYTAIDFGQPREAMELECTAEEYAILREFLEHEGVNLCSSVWSPDCCKVYVRNEWRQVVWGWGTDLMKKLGAEFFERTKRY